jgi:hypothetical protein
LAGSTLSQGWDGWDRLKRKGKIALCLRMMGVGKRSQLRSLEYSLKVTHNRPIDHAILVGQVARLIVPQKGTRS